MLAAAIFTLAYGLSASPLPSPIQPCWHTDYAPESITLRAEPSSKAAAVRSVAKAQADSFVRLDGFSQNSLDWLKVEINGAQGWVRVKDVVCRLSPEDAQKAVDKQTREVIQALRDKDMKAVAAMVHPAKGLRFSPYASVDRKVTHQVSGSQLKAFTDRPGKRTWGMDDGSGDPIRLSFSRYYSKFIYDRDFAAAPKITYNDSSLATKKAWEEFPSAIVVNYSFPESGKNPEDHLLLTFEEQQGKWYLTGIIHDGWTI
jgi:hypothetical protein